jgi:hypothetical protein
VAQPGAALKEALQEALQDKPAVTGEAVTMTEGA